MARMRTIIGGAAPALLLVAALSGCQWPGFGQEAGVSQAPPKASGATSETVPAQPAGSNAPAQPSPTADLAPDPQVAAVQQEVQEFVNRFPDSDLSRKVAGSAASMEGLSAMTGGVTTADSSGQMPVARTKSSASDGMNDIAASVVSPVRVSMPPGNDGAARQASGTSPPVPVVSPARTQMTAIQSEGPALPAGSEPPQGAQPAIIRANSPASYDRVIRAGSFPEPSAGPGAPKVEALEITPVPTPAASETPEPRAEPNRAATASPTPKVRDLDATIAELQKSVAERPNDFAALFRLRMLYLAEGLDDKAIAPVAGLEPETGTLFADLTRTLVAVRDAACDPFNRSAGAIDQARQLTQRLRRQAPVMIDKTTLVSRVNSYGDYDEISPAEFPAGQATRLILYTEISNFRSEKGEGDVYRTLLGETVEVFDAKGQTVFKQVHDKIPDTCRRIRNDFFLALELSLPETLAPGAYTVKATVEDKLSATADQAQIAFTIAATK